MQVHDARVLRGAAIPTAVVGAAAIAAAAAVAGPKGAVGALSGAAAVIAFFLIGQLALGYASRVSPAVMMQVALFTYLVKVLVMFGVIVALSGVSVWNPKAFSWTVIGCTVAWITGEVRAFMKAKILYVEPDGKA